MLNGKRYDGGTARHGIDGDSLVPTAEDSGGGEQVIHEALEFFGGHRGVLLHWNGWLKSVAGVVCCASKVGSRQYRARRGSGCFITTFRVGDVPGELAASPKSLACGFHVEHT